MSFNENGYLGEQINEIMSDIYNQNKELFDYIVDLNSFAQRFKFKIEVRSNELQQILAACIFIKLLSTFQSIFILAQRGLESDSGSLLRVLHEEIFILKKLCEDKDFAEKYPALELIQRKKILNIIKNDIHNNVFDEELVSEFTPEVIEDMINNIDDEVSKIGVIDIPIQQIAEDVGLLKMYNAYRVLSNDVHTTPRSLEKHFKESGDEEFVLNCIPITDNLIPTLTSSIRILFIALENLIKLFSMKFDEEFEQLLKRRDILLDGVFKK